MMDIILLGRIVLEFGVIFYIDLIEGGLLLDVNMNGFSRKKSKRRKKKKKEEEVLCVEEKMLDVVEKIIEED